MYFIGFVLLLLTAELWARVIMSLVQFIKPNLFKDDFSAWTVKVLGGWMHRAFSNK
jgi:hypothetical protein